MNSEGDNAQPDAPVCLITSGKNLVAQLFTVSSGDHAPVARQSIRALAQHVSRAEFKPVQMDVDIQDSKLGITHQLEVDATDCAHRAHVMALSTVVHHHLVDLEHGTL